MKQTVHYFEEKNMYDLTKALKRVIDCNPTWKLQFFELVQREDSIEAIGVYEIEYLYSIRKGEIL